MTEPVLDYEKMIDDKMLLFDKYLERTNMDKKGYQYDGVKWCLRNEILLEKVLQNEDPFAPLLEKVDKVEQNLNSNTFAYIRIAYIRIAYIRIAYIHFLRYPCLLDIPLLLIIVDAVHQQIRVQLIHIIHHILEYQDLAIRL